jgi:pilus assembly protein Flp/PilA
MKALFYALAHKLRSDVRGQDLVEYALIAGFVAVAAGAIFPATLMPGVSTIFSKLADYFTQSAAQGS